MNHRWTLRLVLALGAALVPLLAAFVVPAPTNKKGAPATIRLFSSESPDNNTNESSKNQMENQGDPAKSRSTSRRKKKVGISYNQDEKAPEPYDLLFQKPDSDPFQADFRDSSEPKLMTTFGGGTNLMFEMIAKRMLDWGNEARPYVTTTNDVKQPSAPGAVNRRGGASSTGAQRSGNLELPRWHPHSGISDSNPNFRSQAPIMNNQGFAKSIWRNVRKRDKPSLWRYALRTYDRMAVLEDDPGYLNVQRSNTHHEGAMLACAKLGLWQRALELYHYVYQVEQASQSEFDQAQKQQVRTPSLGSSPRSLDALRKSRIRRSVHVSESMITSLVQACVRASQQRLRNKGTHISPEQEEQEAALRRIPLDTALEVLTTVQETHNIPLVARHVNPLAAAYQQLGYISHATEILQTLLSNRTAGEEPEDGVDIFNVYDLCAKDKGSYSLLVQGAVVTGDWGAAVDALSDMNKAGLYPKQRHCNLWSEISERRTRPRAVGSWKKKRDDYWADSVR